MVIVPAVKTDSGSLSSFSQEYRDIRTIAIRAEVWIKFFMVRSFMDECTYLYVLISGLGRFGLPWTLIFSDACNRTVIVVRRCFRHAGWSYGWFRPGVHPLEGNRV